MATNHVSVAYKGTKSMGAFAKPKGRYKAKPLNMIDAYKSSKITKLKGSIKLHAANKTQFPNSNLSME